MMAVASQQCYLVIRTTMYEGYSIIKGFADEQDAKDFEGVLVAYEQTKPEWPESGASDDVQELFYAAKAAWKAVHPGGADAGDADGFGVISVPFDDRNRMAIRAGMLCKSASFKTPVESSLTDRQLVELAAKAAGQRLADPVDSHIPSGGMWVIDRREFEIVWSPLTNRSDAFQLAMDLNISLTFDQIERRTIAEFGDGAQCIQYWDGVVNGKASATYRAVTRAAAEIELARKGDRA